MKTFLILACALPFLLLVFGALIAVFTEGPRPEWWDDTM